jgi:NAD(P)H-nitrite reductase large subunit
LTLLGKLKFQGGTMSENQRIVIVGSSIAGVSAAEGARKQDAEADILLVSQEPFLPYYRLRVCEVLDHPETAPQLTLHPPEWYDDLRLRRLQGTVTAVDPAARRVRLADGSFQEYTSLVICTGSQSFVPPIPGIQRPGVHTLWLMQNALELAKLMAQSRSIIVIGGGLLGLEAAYHAQRAGLETTVIEKAPLLLANQLDEAGSGLFCRRVQSLGIRVETGADILAVTGRDDAPESPARGVQLADGRCLDADMILVSIGVKANMGFLEGSGIRTERRVLTDTGMQTSVPGIYAAGDVAQPDGYWFGLWPVSRQQGLVAGTNAAGGKAEFAMNIPPYMINTMETRVAVQGDKGLSEAPGYSLDISLDEARGNYRKLVYRDGILRGFMLVGDTSEFVKLQQAMGKPARVAQVGA